MHHRGTVLGMLEARGLGQGDHSMFDSIRDKICTEIETVGGRHDEADMYTDAPGDPGLAGGPGSLSWEINGDMD
jgi:hypothetical protein